MLDNVCRWLRPGGTFHTDTFSPYLIPFTNCGLEANERLFGDHTRVRIYIEYDHVRQHMTEFALVERPGQADCVLEMDLHYLFPAQVHDLMAAAGFDPPSVRGGYDGECFDPSKNEILVYEARRPGARNDSKTGSRDRWPSTG
ncbi:MAG TPA: hypothetical protein VHR66_07455 [Gemmataceae bacterium]|nr:hypothetical protein [Gemmataceae bacterium]